MKKLSGIILLIAGLGMAVFAQDESNEREDTAQSKHRQFDSYFGVSVGAGGMGTGKGGIFTANVGVNYGFYALSWLSVNTGLLFHTEFYPDHNFLTNDSSRQTPLCFTIPFGVHFNIPKAEWLYTGINVAVNIPVADWSSGQETNAGVFISLPIDLGFDFMKPGRGGSRLLFTVTPTMYKGGTIVPVGVVWQIYNWKVFTPKVAVEVPPPPPPVIIVVR